METTNASGLSYPGKNDVEWFNTFQQMIEAVGQHIRGLSQNAELLYTGGGSVSWNATTGTLTWAEDIKVWQHETGFESVIPAGSVVIASGEIAFYRLYRSLEAEATVVLSTGPLIQSPDDVRANLTRFAINVGGICHLPNGKCLKDGEAADVFEAGAASLGGAGTPAAPQVSTPTLAATTVTITGPAPTRVHVYRGGQRQAEPGDFTRAGNTLTFVIPFNGTENVIVDVWI